jgi:CheY-like chemotaxis protein/anti-sigma regulatory factor (Ser/Thr protein kinase)
LNNKESNKRLILKSDRVRIKQIIANLFNNACKFTRDGYVELGLEIYKRKLIIYIEDTGIGISKDNLEVVFSTFRTITDDKTKLFRGAGLGLAISQKIAQKLGGMLKVESELGRGSRFTFLLPDSFVVNIEAVTNNKKYINMDNWRNKRVLIVEDEETNYLYLESALKMSEIKIVWVTNGSLALELFKAGETFDAVLMDIKMPVMNGFDATIEIKNIYPNQVIIAQTAYARAQDKLELQQAGFDEYLIKPTLPEDLLNALSKYMQ